MWEIRWASASFQPFLCCMHVAFWFLSLYRIVMFEEPSDQATLFGASDKSQRNTFLVIRHCFFVNIIIICCHSGICFNQILLCLSLQALKLQPHGMDQLLIVFHCLMCTILTLCCCLILKYLMLMEWVSYQVKFSDWNITFWL